MGIDNQSQLAAAREFTQTVVAMLANEKGVHAETAISSAARIDGTFVLRSCRLPLAGFQPGTSLLFDGADERGQQVLQTVGDTLAALGVPFDARKIDYDLPENHTPLMELSETQAMLDSACRAIAAKHGLPDSDAASAAAISTAILIQKCAAFLDPHIAYVIAVYGIVEASKTVPFDMVASTVQ